MRRCVSLLVLLIGVFTVYRASADEVADEMAKIIARVSSGEEARSFLADQRQLPRRSDTGKQECPPGFECDAVAGTADRTFWIVSAAYFGAMVVDTESTFYALDRCSGCSEGNWLARPFIERGRPVTYPFAFGLTAASVWGAHYLKKQGKWYWWVAPVAGAIAHSYAAQHNYGLVR